jgi:hypothetical protein
VNTEADALVVLLVDVLYVEVMVAREVELGVLIPDADPVTPHVREGLNDALPLALAELTGVDGRGDSLHTEGLELCDATTVEDPVTDGLLLCDANTVEDPVSDTLVL